MTIVHFMRPKTYQGGERAYVTCYMKRDHLGFFINVELLVWMDSPDCVEYDGESFKRKECPQAKLLSSLCTWVHSFNFRELAIKDLRLVLRYTRLGNKLHLIMTTDMAQMF